MFLPGAWTPKQQNKGSRGGTRRLTESWIVCRTCPTPPELGPEVSLLHLRKEQSIPSPILRLRVLRRVPIIPTQEAAQVRLKPRDARELCLSTCPVHPLKSLHQTEQKRHMTSSVYPPPTTWQRVRVLVRWILLRCPSRQMLAHPIRDKYQLRSFSLLDGVQASPQAQDVPAILTCRLVLPQMAKPKAVQVKLKSGTEGTGIIPE